MAQARVAFAITDENGNSAPCRIHLKDEAGKSIRASGLPYFRDHFVCNGNVDVTVPTAIYSYEIERGPEYAGIAGAGSGDASLKRQLKRISNLAAEGWHSGDLHVHRPVEEIPLLMQAEDLDVAPVITWWNNRNLWTNREVPATTLTHFDGRRYFDVMAGEDEREGGALLFFHLPKPLDIANVEREYPSPMKFVQEARSRGGVWIDVEKPFWWDVPVWLAAGAVDSIGIANNHMCRDSMYENEAWGRPRDADRLPAPRGNGYWTQEVYYHMLNCGFRLPPSAGSASGVLPNPVGYNRIYVHTGDNFTYETWWDGLKAGRSFVTNGPLLVTHANGQLPGHVFQAMDGQTLEVAIDVSLTGSDLSSIEVIKNGEVVRTIALDGVQPIHGTDSVSFKKNIGTIPFDKSGWFLIRTITNNPRTFRFASTAPYYVEIGADKQHISGKSAQFFLDWTIERIARVPNKLKDLVKLDEVLTHHNAAREFWQKKVEAANAE